MRLLRTVFAITLGIGSAALVVGGAGDALADNMDPVTERLVVQPNGPFPTGTNSCQEVAANPESSFTINGKNPNSFLCRPHNAAFANLISELGFAMAPTALHPARTTGIGGFALTFEAAYTKINADATATDKDSGQAIQYWHQGTQGAKDPNTKAFGTTNNSPDSTLQLYSLKARKGLPLGFELAGALGYMANTTLWVVGADVRWAPLEGFRTGVLGILPDVAVGGGVRTLAGTSKFTLTTVGLDVQISKRIAIADSSQLTPYVGYQRLWIFGDSTIIDSTPNVDPLKQCGYTGPNKDTGSPDCSNHYSNGAPANSDFNNNFVFQKVRTQRNRGIIGLNYRYEFLYLAGQFIIDLTSPHDDDDRLQDIRQWTMAFEAGVHF